MFCDTGNPYWFYVSSNYTARKQSRCWWGEQSSGRQKLLIL